MNVQAPAIIPHPQFAEMLPMIEGIPTQSWSGNGFRLAALSYTSGILSGKGSQIYGGRWNAPGTFPAVYGSLLPETAVSEAMSRFRKTGMEARRPLPGVLVSLVIQLQTVFDFTDPRKFPAITSVLLKAKRENWQKSQDEGRESTGQAIGRAAKELGVEGILFSSTVVRAAGNIVIFPENLRAKSILRIENKAELNKFIHE